MSMEQLVDIMMRLRDPEKGCPWDREQTFQSIIPYTIEEAYEVADAIEHGERGDLLHELGDLLFQVVFYAQIAKEEGTFDFSDVSQAICEKMIRRHPHVFADVQIANADEQALAWERIKAEERQTKAGADRATQLAGVARSLPSMIRAVKLQKRAAKVGFDWPNLMGVREKIDEELLEVEQELACQPVSQEHLEDEMGDLLFSCVNYSRHIGVDPEAALHRANGKFERRFGLMEKLLHEQGQGLSDVDLSEMDRLWTQVKNEENKG